MIYGKYESVEFVSTDSADVFGASKNVRGRVVGANSLYAQLLSQSVAEVDRRPKSTTNQVKVSETTTIVRETAGSTVKEVVERTRTVEMSGNDRLPLNRSNEALPHGMSVAFAMPAPPHHEAHPRGIFHSPVNVVGLAYRNAQTAPMRVPINSGRVSQMPLADIVPRTG